MTRRDLTIVLDGGGDIDNCDCCGNASRSVWGFVECEENAVAVYYVRWALGKPEHGADFDLILGRWGDDASAEDRFAVSLLYRLADEGAGFMIGDAGKIAAGRSELVSRGLTRDEVVGTPLGEDCFAIVDAIWLQDTCIHEVVHW